MITKRRIFVMHDRCYQRWVWRDTTFDYGIPRPLTEIKLTEIGHGHVPESAIGEIVHKAALIYWARKKPKKGTDLFKAAWYKSMGYKLV